MIAYTMFYGEVKPSTPDRDAWEKLFQVVSEHPLVDAISVHTNPRWFGSLRLVERARRGSPKPVLAKGFHFHDVEIVNAFNAGASWVLVVGRVPRLLPTSMLSRCLIEPLTLNGLAILPPHVNAVWNARDLVAKVQGDAHLVARSVPRPSFSEARRIRPEGWLMQASKIHTVSDIAPNANAILVGTNIVDFLGSLDAIGDNIARPSTKTLLQ